MSDMPVSHGEILLYGDEAQKVYVDVLFMEETFWLPQAGIAELFDSSKSNVSEHLKHIFEEEELDKDQCMRKFGISEFAAKPTNFYNLDAIIAVGYRVNSKKATRFRQWATKTLKEYIQKGFVLNDDMLKNGRQFGKDYFDELLERIREIRASERRAYQKIADIFEQCSYDYDKNSETTRAFYAFVQNKLHFAVTGKTAAELIAERATPDSPTMGLTTWKGAPDGKILAWAQESGRFQYTQSVEEAAKDADVIFTDVWASMGQEEEAKKRRAAFAGIFRFNLFDGIS